MMTVDEKRESEKELVTEMILLYCKGVHKQSFLCPECRELTEYSRQRSDRCPRMENKTFCSNCPVHCYKPEMREKIRAVMRYAGPRMIFHHPIAALRHVIATKSEKEDWREKMKNKIKKIVYIVIGCIGVGLGAVGAVLPLLPAFPFLLLAAVCFAKSSEKLHNWFVGTKLYKNNLETFVRGEGMTWKTKIKVMITVTALMTIGFLMMSRVPIGRIILGAVWAFHIVLFTFIIRTYKPKTASVIDNEAEK